MKKLFGQIVCAFIPNDEIRRKMRKKFNNPKQYAWEKLNPNTLATLGSVSDPKMISVGRGTYGPINVQSPSEERVMLRIGCFCSIGPDVWFILASEHPYRGFSTYPFKSKLGIQRLDAKSKGDIIVGDDVWFGRGVIVNSGVRIGQGAIIASGAVVVRDVEPYSIVGGNPARHIKYRFSEAIRQKLMTIDFENLNLDIIRENLDAAYAELTEDNVDEIIKILTQNKGQK
ncbi:MAG: CatB-related O-acetyltransferase [Alphaproteobacteria bacterium]|nr:CatB-related O-acetyltransferase [Alphaproteobacteria bacterium]